MELNAELCRAYAYVGVGSEIHSLRLSVWVLKFSVIICPNLRLLVWVLFIVCPYLRLSDVGWVFCNAIQIISFKVVPIPTLCSRLLMQGEENSCHLTREFSGLGGSG